LGELAKERAKQYQELKATPEGQKELQATPEGQKELQAMLETQNKIVPTLGTYRHKFPNYCRRWKNVQVSF